MTWNDETKARFMEKARAAVAEYDDVPAEEIPVCVSNGNSKVPCLNISKASGITCGNCACCLGDCYDARDMNRYPNVMNARARNTAVLYKDPARYFDAFESKMSNRRKYKAARYDVGGELTGDFELDAMNATATRKTDWALWSYTKMYDMVNRWVAAGKYTASNLVIMFSQWGVDDVIDNPYGFPVFLTLLPGETAPAGFMKCPGSCRECLDQHKGCPYGDNVYNPRH